MKEKLLEKENNLSKYATKSIDAIRLYDIDVDVRPAFFRDVDKIIHAMSYTRYIDKTQVFSFQDNDHITKRIVHVMLVSKISRTIGRLLNLNEDLIEAIALGHDIGHCPIGHVGESFLNKVAKKEINESFMHNIQSVRNYMEIEKNGKGLNLTIQVLDGIMAHNGEELCKKYYPVNKTKEEFLNEYKNALIDDDITKKIMPMTLEGCVVRISDVIAYIGRDIEDAINLDIIKRSDIPKDIVDILGDNNKDIVNTIILDIVDNSMNKPYISISDNVYDAINKLVKFNYKNIYDKANTKERKDYFNEAFISVYNKFLNDLKNNNKKSIIYKTFLNSMSEEYINNNKKERIVIDFIAGMTDDFFINQYKNL